MENGTFLIKKHRSVNNCLTLSILFLSLFLLISTASQYANKPGQNPSIITTENLLLQRRESNVLLFSQKRIFPITHLPGFSKRMSVFPPDFFKNGAKNLTIIDIGANNGDFYTLAGAKAGYTVLSFEASPKVQLLFRETMQKHSIKLSVASNDECTNSTSDHIVNLASSRPVKFCQISDITIDRPSDSLKPCCSVYLFPVALSDKSETVSFGQFPCKHKQYCGKNNKVLTRTDSSTNAIHISAFQLDSFNFPVSIDSVWYVKIDAEGHEANILRGARKLFLHGSVQFISLEFSPNGRTGLSWGMELLDTLFQVGYACFHLRGFKACHDPLLRSPSIECNFPFSLSSIHHAPTFLEYSNVFKWSPSLSKPRMSDLLCVKRDML